MQITRLDLDGTGSPTGIVSKILAIEPNLSIPVRIENLASQLDIISIRDHITEAFEGCLVTDNLKNSGGILVKKGIGEKRKRFTIGHELGHFLIPTHKPPPSGRFECSRANMLKWSTGAQEQAIKMEIEANNFSSLILMPPPFLLNFLESSGDPDISKLLNLHEHFNVSKEAAARAYATYHSEKIALCIIKDGRLLRIYKGLNFPKVSISNGQKVPTNILSYINASSTGSKSQLRQVEAGMWIELEWGQSNVKLFEQALQQQNNCAMILLWAEVFESDIDPDGDKTAKQRFEERQYKNSR